MQFRYHLYILLFILLLMLLLLVIVFFLLMLIILFILFILLMLIILLLILLLLLYELLPIVCDNSHRPCGRSFRPLYIYIYIIILYTTYIIYIYIYIDLSDFVSDFLTLPVVHYSWLTWSCCDPQSFDVVSQGFQLISWLASLISCSISLIR